MSVSKITGNTGTLAKIETVKLNDTTNLKKPEKHTYKQPTVKKTGTNVGVNVVIIINLICFNTCVFSGNV